MSVGLAAVLPAAFREEDIIKEHPLTEYLWSDLKVRRTALSLWAEDLAQVVGLDLTRYRTFETGGRDLRGAAAGIVDEVIAMEAFVAGEVARLIEDQPDAGTVVLHAVLDQNTFIERYPHARTLHAGRPYPMTLHHVAVGRAAAELRRRGLEVEVYRGDRYFDLAAARLAVGLGKKETAKLLGLNERTYNASEKGTLPGALATMKDLQALDDFINTAAARFEVTAGDGGVSVIWVLDDQDVFEKTYPEARFERSGTPYPVRMLQVAAARRVHALDAAGQPARIAVDD